MNKFFFYAGFLAIASILTTVFSLKSRLSIIGLEPFLLFAEAVLFHLPALLTIPMFRTVSGLSSIRVKFPDILFPSLLIMFWLHLASLASLQVHYLIAGLALSLTVGLASVGARILELINTKLRAFTVLYGSTGSKEIVSIGLRYLYFLRIAGVILSLVLATIILMEIDLLIQNILFLVISLIAGIFAITAITAFEVLKLAEGIKHSVKPTIKLAYANSTATTAIYSSNPRATKFGAEVNLVSALTSEGISVGAILRESHGLDFLKKAGTSPTFFAPTIDSLDYFASPQLKTIFYTNDAQKNGQFVRFQNYKHVLVPSKNLLLSDHLVKGLRMYDAIIAPSLSKAYIWSENSGAQNNPPIAVISNENDLEAAFEVETAFPEQVTLSIYIDPTKKAAKGTTLLEKLSQIANDCTASQKATLTIVVSDSNELTDMFVNRFTDHLLAQNPNHVQVLSGSKLLADQMGDISVTIEPAQKNHFNGRVIYLSDQTAPYGAVVYVPGKLTEAIDTVKESITSKMPTTTHPSVQTFDSFKTFLSSLHKVDKV